MRPVFRDSQVEFLERKKDNAAYDLRKLRGDKRSDTQQTFRFSIPRTLRQLGVDIFDVALAHLRHVAEDVCGDISINTRLRVMYR